VFADPAVVIGIGDAGAALAVATSVAAGAVWSRRALPTPADLTRPRRLGLLDAGGK
jgi:hypothetical protein